MAARRLDASAKAVPQFGSLAGALRLSRVAAFLNRVELTTAPDGDGSLLRLHLQELRRRVERDLGFNGVEMFVVETTEGNGVLHMVWAWSGSRDFIIDQRWLSKQWRRIHGAPIVFIRRMRLSKEDIRRVGRYFTLQYLSDQRGALKRISWSWRRSRFAIGKAWAFMVKAYRSRSKFSIWCGVSSDVVDVTFSDLLVAWEELLERESCMLGQLFSPSWIARSKNCFRGGLRE
jgi:hypothetical protein